MKTIIIAMNNKLQAEKLAIALSHSYHSVVVNSHSKLKTLLKNHSKDLYTIIFEEDENSKEKYKTEIADFSTGKKGHKILSIQITDITSNIKDDLTTIVLKKPFGLKQLNDTIARVQKNNYSDSAAIA